jgi:hypothetical protein
MTVNVRRCSLCSLTYHVHDDFKQCAQCGEDTDVISSDTENPSLKQSRALASRLRGERYARASDEAERAEALVKEQTEADERAARAGAAAIHYDADNAWLAFEGSIEDWASGVAW